MTLKLPAHFHFLPSIVDTQQKCDGLWRARLLQIRVVDTVGGGDRPVVTNLADKRIRKERARVIMCQVVEEGNVTEKVYKKK